MSTKNVVAVYWPSIHAWKPVPYIYTWGQHCEQQLLTNKALAPSLEVLPSSPGGLSDKSIVLDSSVPIGGCFCPPFLTQVSKPKILTAMLIVLGMVASLCNKNTSTHCDNDDCMLVFKYDAVVNHQAKQD